MGQQSEDRTPGSKLVLVIAIGLLLTLPLFAVWLIVYDRQTQSETARASIVEGWGGPQILSGPLLVIPYRLTSTETVMEGSRQVTRATDRWHELTLAPEVVDIATEVRPERRRRSIYEAVIYEASAEGRARFAIPQDLERLGVRPETLDLGRAELRFGLSDPRGLGSNPRIAASGRPLRLQPATAGFFAWIDAAELRQGPLGVDFAFAFRGNGELALAPRAGETRWRLRSPWQHPSFQGSFLPAAHRLSDDGFEAEYRVGNLALGHSLAVAAPAQAASTAVARTPPDQQPNLAKVSLLEPVDLYSRVDRAAKYGFLFIGFTFLAFWLFDVIGGVRVAGVEYLLVGASLILFFVLLLAFAEVIGFAPAYLLASAAITGLNTAYSAAVLKSWRRAAFIGLLLSALYAVLYVLLSLEAYSLLIGSLMLFVALAGVMYLTRNIRWSGEGQEEPQSDSARAA